MTDKDRWVYVNPKTKTIFLRFRVKGFSKQFRLSTGLRDSRTNRQLVTARIEIIERDIALGRFDPSLDAYAFGDKKPKPVKQLNFFDLWEKYLDFQSERLEKSTMMASYKSCSRMLKAASSAKIEDAAAIRDFLLKNYSYHSTYKAIEAFCRCCHWGISSKLISTNPFTPIRLPKPKAKSDDESTKAYTLEQRDTIISAFETHDKFSYYAPLIKFLFWTGCRPGEAFALTWGDISADYTQITISKSYASQADLIKGTKNNKRRIFPCAPDSRLQAMLTNLHQGEKPTELVFKSRFGLQMRLPTIFKCWRGVTAQHYSCDGVVTELAKAGKVPYLKVYATRHTFATWAIASGSSPEKVAYWIGDNVQTVLAFYCHPDVTKAVCPDF